MLRTIFSVALIVAIAGIASSQIGRRQTRSGSAEMAASDFHPVRVVYRTLGGGGSRGFINPWWAIDYPEAEQHFLPALARLTRVTISDDSRHLELSDPEIFNHPFLFLQQPGQGNWDPSLEEAARLQEHLDKGGFLLVDDFHGNYEWAAFEDAMSRVFPERPIVEIPGDDSLMHVFFDLKDRLQIPGRRHVYGYGSQVSVQMEGPPHWRGLYDDRGRLIAGINFNIDMGDAWEHADDPGYPAEMTGQAYRLGVNYVIYAMTH